MNKFPWNCGECPLLHSYDLSVDDLTYVCLWSKAQIDDCDRYESAECPLDKHDAKVRAEAFEDYRKWVKDSPECDDRPCDGMCIDCFIRMEKEQKDE